MPTREETRKGLNEAFERLEAAAAAYRKALKIDYERQIRLAIAECRRSLLLDANLDVESLVKWLLDFVDKGRQSND